MNPFLLLIASSKLWHLNGSIFFLGWKLLMCRSNLEISAVLFLYFWSGSRKNLHSISFYFFLSGQYRGRIFVIYFLCPWIDVDCWVELTVLQNQISSGAATITNNNFFFSVVCLSSQMRLTGKFAFKLFPFYSYRCRLLGRPPLGRILVKSIDISCLLEAVFY